VSIYTLIILVVIAPADSFPTTNVTGEVCFVALLRALFADKRNDRSEVRGNGILTVLERCQIRVWACDQHSKRLPNDVVFEMDEIVVRLTRAENATLTSRIPAPEIA
jgi:hypothetical protein